MKNKLTILFLIFCFSSSKAQNKTIHENLYDDIIEISKDVFYKRSQSKKYKQRNAMFVGISNNKQLYEYIIRQINKGELKKEFKRNQSLYTI